MASINLDTLSEKLSPASRYALAAGLVIFAAVSRALLLPINYGAKFTTFYPAVTMAFYVAGARPGIFAIILSALLSNEATASFLRLNRGDQMPKTYAEFSSLPELSTLDGQAITEELHPYVLALQGKRSAYELKLRRKDTNETWYGRVSGSPIFRGENEITGTVITGLDITDRIELQWTLEDKVKQRTAELAAANQALANLSRHDTLTGLHNRLACNERLRSEFERMKRTGDVYSILMLDIDWFKEVNDRCGHAVGDDVLKSIANTLSSNLREYDFISRWGGEEFLILLPATEFDQACLVAEKLRSAVEAKSHFIAGKVTLSVGVATASADNLDEEITVMVADEGLYEAKRSGRNRVVAKISSTANAYSPGSA